MWVNIPYRDGKGNSSNHLYELILLEGILIKTRGWRFTRFEKPEESTTFVGKYR